MTVHVNKLTEAKRVVVVSRIESPPSTLTFPVASLKCMVLECKVAVAKSPLMAPPFTAKLSENRQPEKRVADDLRRSEIAPPSPLSRVLLRLMDIHNEESWSR